MHDLLPMPRHALRPNLWSIYILVRTSSTFLPFPSPAQISNPSLLHSSISHRLLFLVAATRQVQLPDGAVSLPSYFPINPLVPPIPP